MPVAVVVVKERKSIKMEYFLEMAGIPLFIFVIAVFYAIRLLITKDSSIIRGKAVKKIKDEAGYCVAAAKLLIFFGVAALGMAALSFVDVNLAFAEIVICTVILGILFKKVGEKYGA